MGVNRLALLIGVLALLVMPSLANADACPEGTSGYNGAPCADCAGVACMNQYNASICKGHYLEDYHDYFMWLATSSDDKHECTCWCPFQLYLDAQPKPCEGVTCPDRCYGDTLQIGGTCNLANGACTYTSETLCSLGCNSAALACIKPADLCAGKNCENECSDGYTLKTDGKCNANTGECSYFNNINCPYGCDSASAKLGVCKDEDKCKEPCADKCVDDDYLGTGEQATCDKSTGICDYSSSKKKCAYGCDKEKNQCREPEICDNNIDDDNDGYLDCEDPDCKDSIDCVCKKKEGTGFRTLKTGETPASKTVNIIFVGSGYDKTYPRADTRETHLLGNVRTATNALFDTAPFSFEKANTAVYVTHVPAKDVKSANSPRSIAMARCNAPANAQYVIFEPIGPANECGYADICGNTAHIYASCDVETTFMHEFGHSFGCLWDEYTYGSDWNPINWISGVEFKFMYDPRNCYDAMSEAGCRNAFNVDRCYAGCTSASWYRTTPYSVMWDQKTYQRLIIDPSAGWTDAQDANGHILIPSYYNAQSVYAVNQRLDEYR